VVDDEDRENEGDLVMAAEKITPEKVNFMCKEGRGLICAPISSDIADNLNLTPMVAKNTEKEKTNFTVSVDLKVGTTTGICASDRAKTLKALGAKKTRAADFLRPGHVFPLIGKSGGVLVRAGHTEAAIDLSRLAGLSEAGVICEIIKDDGEMARLPDLTKFAKTNNLKIISIKDLIEYRRKREKLVEKVAEADLPTKHGEFRSAVYESKIDNKEHIALIKGDISVDEPILVRVHSECLTGEVFGSERCDCGFQLDNALKTIDKAGKGVILYMRQEGRGIGLKNKMKAYKLQDEGYDTVAANEALGYKADLREYGIGAQILADLGLKKIIMMTNNPKKVVGLEGYGLTITDVIPLESVPNRNNRRYLKTKKEKMGHILKNV
ncbi:bifunctional 3,4-dihydroxy-2-butanone-4-phosphate synthase/GTP cyclohydrolase II, partial [Pseudomonadota bacterium]